MRRQLPFSRTCPHSGQCVPSLSRLAACPGGRNCSPASDRVCRGLSRARAARCSQSTGQLPVSFTASLQSRALLSHTGSNCSTFPGWCWGTSLVSDPISASPGGRTRGGTRHSWIDHQISHSPRDGTKGGMRRERRTKPRCATWHGLLTRRDRHRLPRHQSPEAAAAPGRSGEGAVRQAPEHEPTVRSATVTPPLRPSAAPAAPSSAPGPCGNFPLPAPSALSPPKMAAGACPPSPGPGAGAAEPHGGRAGPPAPARSRDVKHRPVPRPSPHCQRPHPPPEPRSPSRAAAAQARAGRERSLAAPAAQVGRGGR